MTFTDRERPLAATRDMVAVVAADLGSVSFRRALATGDVVPPHTSPPGFEVNDVLVDEPYAVVVDSDPQEEQPDRATIVDLRSGTTRPLTGEPAPATGSWEVGEGRLLHNHRDAAGRFCVVEADLETLERTVVDCVGERHGITQLTASVSGVGYTTFDDTRPMSCLSPRTWSEDGGVVPLDGATRCRGWEVLPAGDDAVLWTEVPDPEQIERGELFARVGERTRELGPVQTGSLRWCGDHAWWTVKGDDDVGGTVWRWSSAGGAQRVLRVPYEQGVLSAPLCTGADVVVLQSQGATTRVRIADAGE